MGFIGISEQLAIASRVAVRDHSNGAAFIVLVTQPTVQPTNLLGPPTVLTIERSSGDTLVHDQPGGQDVVDAEQLGERSQVDLERGRHEHHTVTSGEVCFERGEGVRTQPAFVHMSGELRTGGDQVIVSTATKRGLCCKFLQLVTVSPSER
jgi:hypothetical protein